MTSHLLLHVCCADCLYKALESLTHKEPILQTEPTVITLFFDNSNIHPRTEWIARLAAVKEVARTEKLPLIVADWSPKKWFSFVFDQDNTHTSRRCVRCWKMRISSTARYALNNGFSAFSTTLLSSIHQDRDCIERIGLSLCTNHLEFTNVTPKLDPHTNTSFYRQNYCGCCYSLVERYEEKHRY